MIAFQLKPILFGLFGTHDKLTDTLPDIAGKGTLERFNEVLADEYDEVVEPLVIALYSANQTPETALSTYIPLLEGAVGNDSLYLSATVAIRRHVQHYIRRYWAVKGTKKFLSGLLNLLGFTVTLTEFYGSYSFDSPTTFDDVSRRFDMFCPTCTGFRVDITRTSGIPSPMTPEEITATLSIITTNTPINGTFESLYYDGTQII